ncbi:PREDICTED: Retrovirus-related Pol poly from transposon TNT [Prunus dulcis]|uniref:PREDICTED: Retrovirus-related Pol poly from transposon TNT n=1 Tax=Prunus dulcis TaxID=3755 RepID=A0A5E4G1Z9_PRUDU|nr:PREDICTED: Retrovirus-related Pol poly from transposon TNT [Prunus dulcis]
MSVFDKYGERKGSKISLGDKIGCDVLSLGIVKIKMQDEVVRSFGDVRNVPALRRNIISFGTLDIEGCRSGKFGGQGPQGRIQEKEVATEKILLTKMIMEGNPKQVELDTRVEEDGHQQQTLKQVLLEVVPSSQERSELKESIKLSLGLGWINKEDSTTFLSGLGSMKWEIWMGALMKKELVHKSKSKVGG